MSQQRLSNDEFLNQLSTLLSGTQSAAHGSVYLTQKSLEPSETSDPEITSPSSAQVLIRATNGLSKSHRTAKSASQKIKLSTIVDSENLDVFYTKYAEVCKKGMESLRKRDKKKAKEKAKAKKKGGKTGAGA